MSHFDISNEIYTLLHEKQEIGVPKLGIFKTKNQSIILDRANGILTPKQKIVTDFEENSAVQNTSLVEYVAYKRRVSYTEAQRMVTNFVNLHKNVLGHQAVYFKNIGKLSKDNSGNITFQPDQHNLSLEQYGLPVLKNVFPIALDKSKKLRPITMIEKPVTTTEQTKSYTDIFFESKTLKRLVILIFLLGIITTVINYNKIQSENNPPAAATEDNSEKGNNDGNTAGLISTDGLDPNAIEAAKKLGREDEDADDEDELRVEETPEGTKKPATEIKEEEPKPEPKPTPTVEPTPKPTTTDSDFILLDNAVYVVIGSYGALANSKKSKGKAEAKGYVGKIEKRSNGHYRVMNRITNVKSRSTERI